MAPRNQNNGRRAQSARSRDWSTQIFSGRIQPPGPLSTDLHREYLGDSTDATSDVFGVFNLAVSADPTTRQDFSNFAEVYKEYRVRGFKLTFVPAFMHTAPPGAVHGFGAGCVSHVSGFTTPANRNACLGSFSSKDLTTGRKWSFEWRASEAVEHNFIACTQAWNFGGIQIWIDNCTPSFKYGYFKYEYIVDFRFRN